MAAWFGGGLPAVFFGLRLWAAVCLALYLAFWLQLDNPSWAGTTAAIVCQPALGASLRKGWFRLIGTVVGAFAAVVLASLFPQDRLGYLVGLAAWGAICAFAATLLRNFASYAAALAGYTAATIAADQLGSVGGLGGDVLTIAVARATEIGLGIVCAGFVLATTDLGGMRRRLAAMLTGLSADIAAGLTRALLLAGPAQAATADQRRTLIVQVAGLETVIDQAAGEIAMLPFRPRVLQIAEEGLFRALFAWRSIATLLDVRPDARQEAAQVSACLPPLLVGADPVPGLSTEARAAWVGTPLAMRAAMLAAVRRLVALPAETPTLRLLADRTADGLLALYRGLTGVLVLDDPWMVPPAGRRVARLRTPDILPALINAIRAFLTIGAAILIWVWIAWPNGATFILFVTVVVTLFAPQEDAAYTAARTYTLGAFVGAILAAFVGFALLPQVQGFPAFCAVLGLVLVPAATLSALPWQPAVFSGVGMNLIPLLSPANTMSYDISHFYNTTVALLCGIGFAMLALRLFPPLPPALRAGRLLALTLRDLRRLAGGALAETTAAWEARVYGRLSALPESVDLLQAARLGSALTVGREILRLRHIADRFGLGAVLRPALDALAAGDSAAACWGLDRFDAALAAVPESQPGARVRIRARGTVRSVAGALTQHASYFDARV